MMNKVCFVICTLLEFYVVDVLGQCIGPIFKGQEVGNYSWILIGAIPMCLYSLFKIKISQITSIYCQYVSWQLVSTA
jgi:hypothetical protein